MDAIRTQETRPVLEITTQNAQMHITNSKPRIRIRSERPVMRVDRQKPDVQVSRQELRKQLTTNLGANVPAAFKAKAERRAMEVLENLPAPPQGQATAADTRTAATAAATPAPMEGWVDPTPAPAVDPPEVAEQPQIEWGNGHVSIEWTDFVLEIDWDDVGGPQIEVEPHSVEVRVENRPVVRFRVNPRMVGDGVGKAIDQSV